MHSPQSKAPKVIAGFTLLRHPVGHESNRLLRHVNMRQTIITGFYGRLLGSAGRSTGITGMESSAMGKGETVSDHLCMFLEFLARDSLPTSKSLCLTEHISRDPEGKVFAGAIRIRLARPQLQLFFQLEKEKLPKVSSGLS